MDQEFCILSKSSCGNAWTEVVVVVIACLPKFISVQLNVHISSAT